MRMLSGLVVVLILAGCAETVRIATSPPDAKVYIEDKYIGESPAEFTVQAHHVQSQYRLRLEKDGYNTLNDAIHSHVAVGRIVLDGLLTCGVVWAFKGWRTFEPVNFELKPVTAARVGPQDFREPLEPHDAELVNKLRRLQDLYDRKLINKQEYESYKADLMKGL